MFPTIHAPTAALHRALDQTLAFAPEYHGGLSNHLPMALAALDGLGADEARLTRFLESHRRALDHKAPPAQDDVLGDDDWLERRGDPGAYPALEAFFTRWLARDGLDTVLRGSLPALLDGVGAAAFHGVIRVAHAAESRHDGELAAALAYWASRWMPLGVPAGDGPPAGNPPDWLDALDALRLAQDADWSPPARLITTNMREATKTRAYSTWAGRSGIDADPAAWLAGLARAAAARYQRTRDFTVLHLCTGTRAARVLARWLEPGAASLEPLAHAVAAASLASNVAGRLAEPPDSTGGNPPLDWPTVIARAIASEDEHVVKLVHTMVAQNAAEPAPVWLAAANAAVAR